MNTFIDSIIEEYSDTEIETVSSKGKWVDVTLESGKTQTFYRNISNSISLTGAYRGRIRTDLVDATTDEKRTEQLDTELYELLSGYQSLDAALENVDIRI